MHHLDRKTIRQVYNGAPGDTLIFDIVDPETGEVRVEVRPVRADADANVHFTTMAGSGEWGVSGRSNATLRGALGLESARAADDDVLDRADVFARNIIDEHHECIDHGRR